MRHKGIRRNLLLLSLGNWVIAIVVWSISAYLGISHPSGIFIYTVLFVIGLFAVVVAIATYALEKFAHQPAHAVAAPAAPGADADAAPNADTTAVEPGA